MVERLTPLYSHCIHCIPAKTADRALEIACGVLKYLQEEVVNGRLDCEFIEYSAEESQKLMMERF